MNPRLPIPALIASILIGVFSALATDSPVIHQPEIVASYPALPLPPETKTPAREIVDSESPAVADIGETDADERHENSDEDKHGTLVFKGILAHSSGARIAREWICLTCTGFDVAGETDENGAFLITARRPDAGKLLSLSHVEWRLAPGAARCWLDTHPVLWPRIHAPEIDGCIVDFGKIELGGALVTWRLGDSASASVEVRCGDFRFDVDLSAETPERVTWLLPGYYEWGAWLTNDYLSFPVVGGSFVAADGDRHEVVLKPGATRRVHIEVSAHDGEYTDGAITVATIEAGFRDAERRWDNSMRLDLVLSEGLPFEFSATAADGATGRARIGPYDRNVVIKLGPPPVAPVKCGFILKGKPPVLPDMEEGTREIELWLYVTDSSGNRSITYSWDVNRPRRSFHGRHRIPGPGRWTLHITSPVEEYGYPGGMVTGPIPFEVSAGECVEIDVGELPPPPWGNSCSKVVHEMMCGGSKVAHVIMEARFPDGTVHDGWSPPSTFPETLSSLGSTVTIARVPPNSDGNAFVRADFPVRVRVRIAGDQPLEENLRAWLFRHHSHDHRVGAQGEEMVVGFADRVAELWLGSGRARLGVRGDSVYHYENIQVPASGVHEIVLELKQGRAAFEFAKGVGRQDPASPPRWQVELWRDNQWTRAFQVDHPSTVTAAPGHYRATLEDAFNRGEVLFEIKKGQEVTVRLKAETFTSTTLDLETPTGEPINDWIGLYAITEDQLGSHGPEGCNDGDGERLIVTRVARGIRLHGLPRGRPCWIWGESANWFLKPMRVVVDGGDVLHPAIWLRALRTGSEWARAKCSLTVRYGESPFLLRRGSFYSFPQGKVRASYATRDGRLLTVQFESSPETPAPIPEELRQALLQDGKLLDRDPTPPPEDPPS